MLATKPGRIAKNVGDVETALEAAARRLDWTFDFPFLAHATMEPMNGTVNLTKDGCDIWVGTQVPGRTQAAVVKLTGLKREQVRIHNHLLGGGFGRRLEHDDRRAAPRAVDVQLVPAHVDEPSGMRIAPALERRGHALIRGARQRHEHDDRESDVRQASAMYLGNIRSFVSGLAADAGAPDPDGLAHKWHILMKGSIVAAGEGDRDAAKRAQDMGRLLLADAGIRHDPARGDRLRG